MASVGERTGFPLSGAWVVARREIGDQLRDWRILAPITILTLFFPVLMNLTARQVDTFVSRYGATVIGERLMPFLLMIVGFFPISISLVIALESFSGERERLSLEPLLATPLRGSEIFLGKVIASLAVPLAGAYLGILVYLVSLAIRIHWYPTHALLLQVVLLTTAQAVMMVSAAVVISSQATSVRAANLLASFIIVPVSELIIGESIIMFWGRQAGLWLIVFGLLVVSVLLWRMGLHLFNREQLLNREIDHLDLRWVLARFWNGFRRGARTPGEWYRGLFGYSLPRIWRSMIVMLMLLIGGYFIGLQVAGRFRIPPELMDLDSLGGSILEPIRQFGMLSGQGWIWVVLTNLKALAFATLMGALSLSVLGLILLMVPVGILGYISGNLLYAGHHAARFAAAFVLPHGVLEIPLTIIAGAAILELAMAVVTPAPGASLGESWLMAWAEWARIFIGIVLPLLLAAATLEVFLTPRVAMLLFGGA